VVIRLATPADAPEIAALHADRIAEGFLPTLGAPFLERLYRRVTSSQDAFAYVAGDDGRTDGFVACALDVRALYRAFLLRDGARAGIVAAPQLLRSWRRVVETLRYPSAAADLPRAEVLSVAVTAAASGRGIGRSLVAAATAHLREREVVAAKVVTGAANDAAMAMYEHCGFAVEERIEVHGGVASVVLVWRAAQGAVAP
jgi:ribosomal protein S18 acetylase RimI-like enzyme